MTKQEAAETMDDLSPVQQMFNNRSVFITGASGFIGRVLLEKLLRCYVGIKRIYILMRAKKNMSPSERLHKQLLKVPIFDHIRSMPDGQKLLDKIIIVTGDIGEDQLGLSESDLKMILDDPTLSVVFHSAATVRFDEPLKTSIKFNLMATQILIGLCRRMPNLVALCHVSTAYVNADQKNSQPIEEQIYPINHSPLHVIKLAKLMDDNMMSLVKPMLIGERPNTYTYTKALGEHLIALEASDLPVAIVRPSIVVASWKEPLAGWVDNLNGPTGLILAIGKGLLRSMHTNRNIKAEVIPVDIVVNTMIASAYYAARSNNKLSPTLPAVVPIAAAANNNNNNNNNSGEQQKRKSNDKQQTTTEDEYTRVPPIFHCTSGDINPISWGNMEDMFFPIIRKYPSRQVLRYPFGSFKGNKYHDLVTRLFVHFLPALIIDLLCMIMGKKRQLMSIYFKLHSAVGALSHFSTTNYEFRSRNIQALRQSLTHPRDQKELFMDISTLDWHNFWDDYVLGARRYVLKEDDQTLEESRQSFRRAMYLEYAFRAILILVGAYLFVPLIVGNVSQYSQMFNLLKA